VPTINSIHLNNSHLIDSPSTTNSKIIELHDKQTFEETGGKYLFFENGALREYNFFQIRSSPRYTESYNKLGGLTKREGNPILFTSIIEVLPDSLVFNFYVSNISIRALNLFAVINKTDTLWGIASNNTIFSNTINYQVGYNAKNKYRIEYKSNLSYNSCKDKAFFASDSGFINHSSPN